MFVHESEVGMVVREDLCLSGDLSWGCQKMHSIVLQAGESMPSSRSCYTKTCERDAQGTFVTRETQTLCDSLDTLPPCQDVSSLVLNPSVS